MWGGGDSAIEAAVGLAEQPGNQVALSYRKSSFFRLKARNEANLAIALHEGKLQCLFESHVREITPTSVCLEMTKDGGSTEKLVLDNDEVFIMAGGIPPFKLLEECGVSFDPSDRTAVAPLVERGTGLLRALYVALSLSIGVWVWILIFQQYYSAAQTLRPLLVRHVMLRPSSPFGLACGAGATLLIGVNLAYLVRRNWLVSIPGSLATWMTSHVVTGILALLLVLIHAAMSPQHALGGHAFAALGFLVITGAIGRYFYSFVPRAVNGQELALEELNGQMATEATQWDRFGRGFGEETQQELHALVAKGKWKRGFFERLLALMRTQRSAREIY